MSTQRQIWLGCVCWQQTVPNRYIKVELNVGYFQWSVPIRKITANEGSKISVSTGRCRLSWIVPLTSFTSDYSSHNKPSLHFSRIQVVFVKGRKVISRKLWRIKEREPAFDGFIFASQCLAGNFFSSITAWVKVRKLERESVSVRVGKWVGEDVSVCESEWEREREREGGRRLFLTSKVWWNIFLLKR